MIPIVNPSDQIISYKERHEVDSEVDIVRSASLVLVDQDGRILLAQRSFDRRSEPGKWGETVGGTVENEESYEETIRRESAEELGLNLVDVTPTLKSFRQGSPSYIAQWFVAQCNSHTLKIQASPDEVASVRWTSAQELAQQAARHPDEYIRDGTDILSALRNYYDLAA